MRQGEVSLDMSDYERLDIIYILTAGRGIADMAESHVSLPKALKLFVGKDFGCKAVAFIMREYAVIVDSYSAGFLTSVLQSMKAEIYEV